MNGHASGLIRTPDQRVRVFVSSTLRELAAERRAARAAIERLALTPVMFELGARPHPPRSLYRAYLEQSDVFVGLYGDEYGWVAPGEEVSGLEDEYNLAPDIPMLIYVRRSGHRHPRLESLLARIRDDDRASYVSFASTVELRRLLTSDLATLLAERFAAGGAQRRPPLETTPDGASTALVAPPSPLTPLLGRGKELSRVVKMLTVDGRRLVTITGPGGIGKSRLAIAAAREAGASFPDGVAFVDLASVRDPALVCSSIAAALGIRDTGDAPIRAKVVRALADRRVLLILDNVEQVVDAATELSSLLTSTGVAMLATSRIVLRIDGEQSLALHGLPDAAATELFIERARSNKPDFAVTERDAGHIAAICSRLDNMPLALELAAARIRVLTPAEMVDRLDRALALLVSGNRDRPARQRTLRATIDWSTELLEPEERSLLLRLGVFRKGFDLDAVEWMNDGLSSDAVRSLGALVDGSLVIEHDRGSRAWFTMLATVREYAREQLEKSALLQQTQERHARFFIEMAARVEPELFGRDQGAWMSRVVDAHDEFRATAEHLLATGQWDELAELVWRLYPFLYPFLARGQVGEMGAWLRALLERDRHPSARTLAIAEFVVTSISAWQQSEPRAVEMLEHAAAAFHRSRDRRGESLALTTVAIHLLMRETPDVDAAQRALDHALAIAEEADDRFAIYIAVLVIGRMDVMQGRIPDALRRFDTALDAARSVGDRLRESAVLNHIAWAKLLVGDVAQACDLFREQILISASERHDESMAWALEGIAAVSAARGDTERAGTLVGATDAIRERRGLLASDTYRFHRDFLREISSGPHAAAFEEARRAGRGLDLAAAVELASR